MVVFADAALAAQLLTEIATTPSIEGSGAVAVALPPEFLQPCPYIRSTDGRVAIAHWSGDAPGQWSEAVVDWLAAYLAEYIADGRVQILDALPADWQYPEVA